MSATIEKPLTATERATQATAQLRELFGFENLKAMSIAIAEVAAQEAKINPAFAERIQQVYHEVEKTVRRQGTSKAKRMVDRPKLTPIAKVEGYVPDPFAPLDPYFMLKIYGVEQFPLALEEQTLVSLKFAAKKLMESHPGTKPTSMARKDDVIAYIVEIVTKDKQ
jgi:hypothetical protein